MTQRNHSKQRTFLLSFLVFLSLFSSAHEEEISNSTINNSEEVTLVEEETERDAPLEEKEEEKEPDVTQLKIKAIIVSGNKHVPTQAILNRIPYRVGELFDPRLTRELINNLYFDLKRFRNISVSVEPLDDEFLNLHIVLEEKKLLKDVIIKGNKQVSTKEINEKIDFSAIPAVDPEELAALAQRIKKLYIEKGFHETEIDTEIQVDNQDKAVVIFTIHEHKKSLIKKISFIGNCNVSSKELRTAIYSKEDWLLSFMDKAGTYHKEKLEGDKQMIEQYYQNLGYLNARVVDTSVDVDTQTKSIDITYEIEEGERYYIASVSAAGNDILPELYLLARLPVRVGQLYSRERIMNSIKVLENIWGDLGYIFAHIDPTIIPNEDDCTLNITFNSDIGEQVTLNRITITGNTKTRDRIVRRQIGLEEGNILSASAMEYSKNRVESLGFFEVRDGVNWKINRLNDHEADLDLIVNEAKTGNASVQLNFGGAETTLASPFSGLTAEFTVSDTNLMGQGIRMNLTGKLGKDEKTITFNITEPWLFDSPIFGAFDFYHQRFGFDEFNFTAPVNAKHTGGYITSGIFFSHANYLLSDTYFRAIAGFEGLGYEQRPRALIPNTLPLEQRLLATAEYNFLLDKMFDPGKFAWVTFFVGQDKKNHPMHPSFGYAWNFSTKIAIPTSLSNIAYYKLDWDYNWYTPLIGAIDLVFHWHSYIGYVKQFRNRVVPYGELFHIGGPSNVRGFVYGQIGPQFVIGDRRDSIGGSKAFFVNAELLFPITADMNMKGVVFYDGGSGWDNPYLTSRGTTPLDETFPCPPINEQTKKIPSRFVRNNNFSYRHAVGFGIRMLSPMPIRIDWGFKLDPRKGESKHEVHFSMNYGF